MKIAKYFLVGGMAAVVDLAIFFIFAKVAGFNYLFVGAVGFTMATLVNYLLSVRFVFRSGVRFSRHQEVALVFAVSLVGLAINQLVLYVGIEHARAEMMLSKIAATAMAFLWNFAARNNFVFKGQS